MAAGETDFLLLELHSGRLQVRTHLTDKQTCRSAEIAGENTPYRQTDMP